MESNYIANWPLNRVCSTHTKGGEVPNLELEVKGDEAKVVVFSDIHMGAISFNEDLFKKYIQLVKDIDAYIILAGDVMETAMPGRQEQALWEQNLLPDEQFELARSYFEPLKDRILFSVTGNHDMRIWKRTSIDISKILAEKLGCFYNKQGGYLVTRVGNKRYTWSIWHGFSSSVDPFRELEKRFAVYDQADITAMGNNHFLGHKTIVKKRFSGGRERRELVHLVRTGGFLSEPDYSRQAQYAPTVEGAPIITLNAKRKNVKVDVQGELHWT